MAHAEAFEGGVGLEFVSFIWFCRKKVQKLHLNLIKFKMIDYETNIERINKTFNDVSDTSFQEKRAYVPPQYNVDNFLDKILDFKNKIKVKTDRISYINCKLEDITWYKNIDDVCLKMINEVISACKDLHSILIRYYVDLGYFLNKSIAKDEIKELKLTIDELKEITQDLESTFFFLPQMPEFKETTRQLSLL